MTELPSIGDPVVLRDAADLHYSSRVEDLLDGVIVVARPADLRAAIVYDSGYELDLIWTLATGIHVLPTRLGATSVDGVVRLWHLEITGRTWTEQRRDYVRVPLTGSVRIDPDENVPETAPRLLSGPLVGTFIDLSEVAAQVVVTLDPDVPPIRERTAVRCRFSLSAHDYDLRGSVIIVRPGAAIREQRLVVRFDISPTVGDALRKEVFALQLGMRRSNG